jgi:hypothetical protein
VTQVIAVDWWGGAMGAAEAIWLPRVADGRLVELENGLGRAEAIEAVTDCAREDPRTVVGLDFAFSVPRWYCDRKRSSRTASAKPPDVTATRRICR